MAVVGTAALAAAVFGGEDPDNRALLPEMTTSASLNLAVSEEPSPSSTSPTADRTPSRTPSPESSSPSATPSTESESPSASTSASASASSSAGTTTAPAATGSPSATGHLPPSATSTGTAPTAPETSAAPTTTSASPAHTDAPEGATLSLGSTGPEVRELQERLRFLWVYLGDADGVFDDGLRESLIEYQSRFWRLKDPEGVYGPHTRRELEEQTDRYYD
ncbi:peptidoglycan-binding protein [Streptomyces sp. NPDC058527]|uniref:peptidoglycan-binding domain-containing protein n=1 Tax=Streptomyces sp. NPDC058527 TaxID=3346539 RepID=UPI00365702A6